MNGPVDATYKTIKNIVRLKAGSLSFQSILSQRGWMPRGDVFVRLEEDGNQVIGTGADTDIIVASAKAY